MNTKPFYWDEEYEQHVERGVNTGTGKNNSPIFGIRYINLPRSAQTVIYNVWKHGAGGMEDWFYFDRDGVTEFKNRGEDLPDGGPYREYTVLVGDTLDSGRFRIVHDESRDLFYFTPYHYERKLRGNLHGVGTVYGPAALPPEVNNPFFRVIDIPTGNFGPKA